MATAKKLALEGGEKAVTTAAPKWPVVTDEDAAAVAEVVKSGKWSWLGPQEMAFCDEYARFIGSKRCLCLANGTVTIQCALQAVGVKPGDEVIAPGLTWVATIQAALDIGANVVMVDVDPETLCMDPAAARAAVTPRTRALLPVHLYGAMCDMDAILALAKERGLKVVEDVAHQHGSQWRGVGAGALGDAGSFSFQQSKVLTCGEGGAVTCNDEEVYRTVFALKQVGWAPKAGVAVEPGAAPALEAGNLYGHNYRMTEMQAALLRRGLARLEEQTRRREENAAYLTERLAKMGGPLRAARRDARVTRQAYYCMHFVFDPAKAGVTREEYRKALAAEGISFGTPYAPVYRHPLLNLYHPTSPVPFRSCVPQTFHSLRLPNVEKACEETGMLLGQPPLLGSRKLMDEILAAVEKVNKSLGRLRKVLAAQQKA